MPVVASRSLLPLISHPTKCAFPALLIGSRRVGGYKYISVQATPATDSTSIRLNGKTVSATSPDASFEVLGAPYSLLSVTLSPSQDLHTRRGSLVGLSGPPDSVVSKLRVLNPVRRSLVGIPFLYQRITSTSPISALICTKSPNTTFAVIQLDGTTDWKIAQRKALLAWTGKTLSVRPSLNQRLSLAFWGNSDVTGRGLLALAGHGQVYSLELGAGETYVVHPSNLLAYSLSSSASPPQPYRFKSTNVKFQIPLVLGNFFPSTNFVRTLRTSNTYKFFANISLRLRTWSRRTIWGDRLFLQFTGPTTLLIQSHGPRVSDILSSEEVNEIADARAGSVENAVRQSQTPSDAARTGVEGATPSASAVPQPPQQPKLSVASISRDGKVTFEATQSAAKQIPPAT